MIGIGIGIGLNPIISPGGGAPTALTVADFTSSSLPAGWTFSRGGSAGERVQTSESTLSAALTADQPGFGRWVSSWDIGLDIDGESGNYHADKANHGRLVSELTTAGSGTTIAASGLPGPDGTGNPERVTVTSAGFSRYQSRTGLASAYSRISLWYRAPTGTTSGQINYAGARALGTTATETWQVVEIESPTQSTASTTIPVDGRDMSAIGGIVAGARDVIVDFMMDAKTNDRYRHKWTPNTSVAGEAASTTVQRDSNDRWAGYVRCRTKGARSDYAGGTGFVVFRVDANNYAYVATSTGYLTIVWGGATVYTGTVAATWSALDEVEFDWLMGADIGTTFAYRVNGATWTAIAAHTPLTPPANGANFSPLYMSGAWLYRVEQWPVSVVTGPVWDGEDGGGVDLRSAGSEIHATGALGGVGVKTVNTLPYAAQAEVAAFRDSTNVSAATMNVLSGTQYHVITPNSTGVQQTILRNGPGVFTSGDPLTGSITRAYVAAVYGRGLAAASPSAPASRLVVCGDSISNGFGATNPTTESWPNLMRTDYPGRVTLFRGLGSLALYHIASDAPTRAGTVAALGPMLNGTANVLWLSHGFNDYGSNLWTAAAFGTAYDALLDAIHAAYPSLTIFCQSPITATVETANGLGSTLGNYRTQIQTACSARAWTTFVDGTSVTPAMGGDGVHPTTAGHATLKAAWKAVLGY